MVYKLGDVDWDKFGDKYRFGSVLEFLDPSLTEVDSSFGEQAQELVFDYSQEEFEELLFAQAEPIVFYLYDISQSDVSEEAKRVIQEMREDVDIFYDQSTIMRYMTLLDELGVEPVGKERTRLLFTKSVDVHYDIEFDGEVVTCTSVVCANTGPDSYNDDLLTAVDINPDVELNFEPEFLPDYYGVDAVLPIRALSESEGRTATNKRTVRVEDAIAAGCGATDK